MRLNSTREDSDGYSYVFHQAEQAAQEAACLAALEECPVEAIGDDTNAG